MTDVLLKVVYYAGWFDIAVGWICSVFFDNQDGIVNMITGVIIILLVNGSLNLNRRKE